jgi:hypothetical protein
LVTTNYNAYARGNYFRVHDSGAFTTATSELPVSVITRRVSGAVLVGLLCDTDDYEG